MNLLSEPHDRSGTDRPPISTPQADASKPSARGRFPLVVTLSAAIVASLALWGVIAYIGRAGLALIQQ